MRALRPAHVRPHFLSPAPARTLSIISFEAVEVGATILDLSSFGFLGSRLRRCRLFAMTDPHSISANSLGQNMTTSEGREGLRGGKVRCIAISALGPLPTGPAVLALVCY